MAASWMMVGLLLPPPSQWLKTFVLASVPLLGVGAIEDIRRHLPAPLRAAAGLTSAGLLVGLQQLGIERVGMPWLDPLLQAQPLLAAGLAMVAIGSLPHAFNMVDGINGLAAAVGAMTLGAIAYVAQACGDTELAHLSLTLLAATLGFLLWNWPRAMLFMGDTGAYLLGFACAALGVALVQRHAEVSPWFALLALLYPSLELLFSLFRRRVLQHTPGMRADALHLHHLLLRVMPRLLQRIGLEGSAEVCHALSALPLLAMHALALVSGALLWRVDGFAGSLGCCLAFVLVYVAAYVSLHQLDPTRCEAR